MRGDARKRRADKHFLHPDGDGAAMAPKRLEATWAEVPTHTATIIGLSGYAQSGKDSTGKVLVEHYGFTRLAFADALKNVLYSLNPACDGMMDGLQRVVDEKGWEYAKASDHVGARRLLQNLGVAVREHVDPDAWCDAVMRQCEPGGKYAITDVRFPNEWGAIKKNGGEVWRIERAGHQPPNLHVSETALADYKFDRTFLLPDFHDNLDALDHALRVLVDDALGEQ